MLYQGEEIKKLIPQRDPIMMVDKFYGVEGETAETGLSVKDNNFFIEEDGMMAEPGLIEHIAQSASAFAGHKALVEGLPTPVGYIGEVKKFHCYGRPAVGDELRTKIEMGATVNGVTLLSGETYVVSGSRFQVSGSKFQVSGSMEKVADTQMKIFIEK